ncbi:MAG: thioredoxin [Oscillospiraceae bacterium]|nr:thioredoxin [Oscillospiraceae bacterium]
MAHLDVTRENFDELLVNIGKPVLLDFWAPWCGPCKQISPIVEQIGAEREDIIVGKVNVDEEMELAQRYKVMSIPTLVVLNGGKVAGKAVGFRSKEEILKLISQK